MSTELRRKRRAHRLLIASASALMAVVIIVAAITVPAYVFPPVERPPAHADVIYVIGPPTEERVALAEQMRRDGVADNILISVTTRWSHSAERLPACKESYVTCVHPEPFTTAGEMSELKREYGADARAVVITFTPHVSRTRFIAGRCAGAQVTVVGVPAELDLGRWIYQFAYQTGGFAKALIVGCP